MSLICQTIYATADNGKLPIVQKCLVSLAKTVDLKKHRCIIVNNSCHKPTADFLDGFQQTISGNITVIHLTENVGTAKGINIGLRTRKPGEMTIKCDDDIEWGVSGWVDQLEKYMKKDIGILGLKRKEVWQHPNHQNPKYRTVMEGKLEICDDIFGTCTAYNPAMLDKVGYLMQPTAYGFDDVLISLRSKAAGFRNAFLPHVPIENLDLLDNDYTKWKKLHAGEYIDEVSEMCRLIENGTLSYYYAGE